LRRSHHQQTTGRYEHQDDAAPAPRCSGSELIYDAASCGRGYAVLDPSPDKPSPENLDLSFGTAHCRRAERVAEDNAADSRAPSRAAGPCSEIKEEAFAAGAGRGTFAEGACRLRRGPSGRRAIHPNRHLR